MRSVEVPDRWGRSRRPWHVLCRRGLASVVLFHIYLLFGSGREPCEGFVAESFGGGVFPVDRRDTFGEKISQPLYRSSTSFEGFEICICASLLLVDRSRKAPHIRRRERLFDALGGVPFSGACPPSCRFKAHTPFGPQRPEPDFKYSQTAKGPARPNRTGPPGRFSSLITRLQSSQITGVQCRSARYESSGMPVLFQWGL